MSLLIPGPHSLGREIDVYLRSLIDELKELWHDGIKTYDFKMHATILWTINNFPVYGIFPIGVLKVTCVALFAMVIHHLNH